MGGSFRFKGMLVHKCRKCHFCSFHYFQLQETVTHPQHTHASGTQYLLYIGYCKYYSENA